MHVRTVFEPFFEIQKFAGDLYTLIRGDTIEGTTKPGFIATGDNGEQEPCHWLTVTVNGFMLLHVPTKTADFQLVQVESLQGGKVRLTRLSNPYSLEL